MAREDFREKKEKLNGIGIIRVAADFYQVPDSKGFVKSPATPDKTRSCKLYPETGTFFDYAGNKGGDIIAFVAYIKGTNNWESLKLLSDYYGLSGADGRSREERQRMMQRQKQEDQKRTERQQAFHEALMDEIEYLKRWEDICKSALKKSEIEPFSNLWAYVQNELQYASYRLDILTGADMATYRRLKPHVRLGLSSDYPQWLLDTLDILAEAGKFKATAEELSEIKAQWDFESKRKPGADRRCAIAWK